MGLTSGEVFCAESSNVPGSASARHCTVSSTTHNTVQSKEDQCSAPSQHNHCTVLLPSLRSVARLPGPALAQDLLPAGTYRGSR